MMVFVVPVCLVAPDLLVTHLLTPDGTFVFPVWCLAPAVVSPAFRGGPHFTRRDQIPMSRDWLVAGDQTIFIGWVRSVLGSTRSINCATCLPVAGLSCAPG